MGTKTSSNRAAREEKKHPTLNESSLSISAIAPWLIEADLLLFYTDSTILLSGEVANLGASPPSIGLE